MLEEIPRNCVLVFTQRRKELDAEVLLFKGSPKLRRVKPDLRLLVEFYHPKENLLRARRVRVSSNRREEYIQPKEFVSLLRGARRIIITADLDFPRLLALSSAEGPGLILFRGGNYSDSEMRALLDRVLKEVRPEVLERSICVVDAKRIRMTRLPLTQRER